MTTTVNSALKKLLQVLASIEPKVDNKNEWKEIRRISKDNLGFLENDDERDDERVLNNLLTRLSITKPGTDNIKEWKNINDEAKKILESKKTTKKKLLDLLILLAGITPGKSNKKEWKYINEVSSQLIENFTESNVSSI